MSEVKNDLETLEIPTGVKIISVLFYIVAGLYIISGLISIFGGPFVLNLISSFVDIEDMAGLGRIVFTTGSVIFIVFGIFIILFSILYIILGIKLRQGKNWARWVVIVLSIIGALATLYSIIGPIINVIIAVYLIVNKDVKEFFEQND